MSFHGLKISKPGYNVLTETDPNNLQVSSDYGTLKYEVEGSVTLTGTTTQTQTVAHNLGYIPFIEAFVRTSIDPDWYGPIPFDAGNYSSGTGGVVAVDENNIYFKMTQSGGGWVGALTFFYKLFRNKTGL